MKQLVIGCAVLMLLAACGHVKTANENPLKHAGPYHAIRLDPEYSSLFRAGDHRATKIEKPSCPSGPDTIWLRLEVVALPKGALKTFSPELQAQLASGKPVSQWVLDRLFTDSRARSLSGINLTAKYGDFSGFQMVSSTNPPGYDDLRVNDMVSVDLIPFRQPGRSFDLYLASLVSLNTLQVNDHVTEKRAMNLPPDKYACFKLTRQTRWDILAFLQAPGDTK